MKRIVNEFGNFRRTILRKRTRSAGSIDINYGSNLLNVVLPAEFEEKHALEMGGVVNEVLTFKRKLRKSKRLAFS